MVYWKSSNFNKISMIVGTWYGFHFNFLFKFLKSLRKRTWFDLGLGCAKYVDTHSDSFDTTMTPSKNKRSTYFWTFPCVPLLLGMFMSILTSNPILTQSLMDMISKCQVFHRTTLRISVKISSINHVVSLLNVDTEFP